MITTLFDRVLFTLCFLIGVQLPEFVQQYSQRLSGHLNEAQHQLQQFQFIADTQYQGSLVTLIKRYQENSDLAIQQTGQLVNNLSIRITELDFSLNQLQQNNYWQRIYYFVTDMNIEMAQATAKQYILAIPLEMNALITGVLFAVFVLITKALIVFLSIRGYLRLRGFATKDRSLI